VTSSDLSRNAPSERPVHLLIADISGFTQFIWAHRESLAHAQLLINDLLGAVLDHAGPPFEIAKLEGDAVFFYLPGEAAGSGERLAEAIPTFFASFRAKQKELAEGNLCHCSACTRIESLRLKVILHRGTALFFSLGGFQELSGPDVITVHRLTKNSVASDHYLLATAPAYEHVRFPSGMRFEAGEERYPDIGVVPVHLHFPEPKPAAEQTQRRSIGYRFGREWIKYVRTLPYRFGLRKVTLTREESDE
jgi:hypothetical protein